MTFPATTPFIEAAEAAHGLVQLTSVTKPGEEVRHLYVTPEVKEFLDNPPPEFVPLQFYRTLDRYLLNYLVVASVAGTSQKTVAFERLSDVEEVWVMCVRKPNAGQWRFFGRFAAPGIFVVMLQKSRIECGTLEQYAVCIQAFEQRWVEVFGDQKGFTGVTCEDFFGDMVSDIDAE